MFDSFPSLKSGIPVYLEMWDGQGIDMEDRTYKISILIIQ